MIQNLSALATFIKVSKHLSFTKAAKELFLSQGAVSAQIKSLEEELGFPLFHRKIRQIFLTNEGKRLLKSVEPALNQIQTTIESIRTSGNINRLSVSMLPSVATRWMIPRISDFHKENPQYAIKVHTSGDLVDFVAEQVDCAIRFGQGKYPGLSVTHLIDEDFFPVCHPSVRNSDQPLKDPEEIKRFTLLQDVKLINPCNISWEAWAEHNGVKDLDLSKGIQYDQADYAIQAAMAGQGVALGRVSLMVKELKEGLLVPLFEQKMKCNFSYYLVHPEEYSNYPGIQTFKKWIIKQMNEDKSST